ncbi:MAG: DUF4296 domain-containing protein [Bacteroidota bacterium]
MRKILSILFIFSVCVCFSCGSKKTVSVPDNIIPRDSMPSLLADVYLTEAGIAYKTRQGDTTIPKQIGQYYDAIFAKHKTSKVVFDSSISWYSAHPEMMFTVYQDALDMLVRMQSEKLRGKS